MIHSFENTLLNALLSPDNNLITAPTPDWSCSLFPTLFAAAVGNDTPFALVVLSKYNLQSLQSIFTHFCRENQDLPLNVEFFDAHNLSKMPSRHYQRRILYLTPDDFKDEALTLLAFYLQPSASSPLSLIWPYPVMPPNAYTRLSNAFGALNTCSACPKQPSLDHLNIYFVPQYEHFDEHFSALLQKLLPPSPSCLFSNLSADIRLIAEFSHRIHHPAVFLSADKQKMNTSNHRIAYSPHACFLDQPSGASSFIAMNDHFDTAAYLNPNVDATSGHAIPVSLSFIADNDFSLLDACAECICPAEAPVSKPFHTAAKIFCRFAELHHTPCHADTLRSDFGDALARDVFETWRGENLIAPLHTDPCALTYSDNGQQYFNHTIGCLSPFQYLLYRHPVMCQTPNGENIGLISADMLSHPAAAHFNVKNISFRRNIHDVFNVHATCTVCPPIDYPFWLDAMPKCLPSLSSHAIQHILCDDLNTNEPFQKQIKPHFSDDIAHQRIQTLNSKFKTRFTTPYRHTLHLEQFESHAMLWTFAGASANAICAQFIQNHAPNFSVAYGNFAILFASDHAKTLSSLPEYIDDFLSVLSGKHQDLSNSLIPLCQSAHPFAPFSKLLPQTVQNDLTLSILQSLRDAFPDPSFYANETNDPLFLDLPWTTFPTPQKHIETKIMQTIQHHSDDATYPINYRTMPFFIDNGCLHTQTPWFFVNSEKQFNRAIDDMLNENIIGLDVETTLYDQDLRLIQIGLKHKTFVIDPLSIDFKNLISVLENPNIIKLIHNASFEKRVLLKYNIQIHNIVDTLSLSKKIYGTRIENGHSLKAVCQRIFGAPLDKTSQTSDWSKRPLSPQQLEYAALDAEILVRVYDQFMSIRSPQKSEPLF